MGGGSFAGAPPIEEAMKSIQNITTDDLGFEGFTIPGGASIEVEDTLAEQMTARLPDKFALVSDRSMASAPKRGKRRKATNRAVE